MRRPCRFPFLPRPCRSEKRALEHSIEDRPGFSAALFPCTLHLAVNLRFTEYHRLEPCRDSEEVRGNIPVAAQINELRGVFAQPRRENLGDPPDGIPVLLDRVDLGTVARR